MATNIETIKKSRKGKIVVGLDPTKKTSFLPHTIEDKLSKAAKNVRKFVDKITD